MLFIILGILVFLLIIGILLYQNDFDINGIVEGISIIGLIIIGAVFLGIISTYPFKVEEKIKMYTQENIEIENKIKATVQLYMDYETETYNNLVENADLTTLVIKYPELNSNELVKYEIETYKENNDKIKELKEDKIKKNTLDWWLFLKSEK